MSSPHEPHRPPAGRFTKSAARNIFYGGSIFFFLVFVGLTAQSHWHIVTKSTDEATLTEGVIRGKHVWEKHACVNCHSILGEGAYFAPEVGNVWVRYGGKDDPQAAREGLIAWMQAQPSGIEGRRQMPQFHLSDEDIRALTDFLLWTGRINTQNWPPNELG